MTSRKNADRVNQAITEIEAGSSADHALLEP